jgi:hypothetical protein
VKNVVKVRCIVVALAATPLLLAVVPSAGASSPGRTPVSQAGALNSLSGASSLPTTKIIGSPPAFSPTVVTATATGGTCRPSVPVFKVDNRESVNQHVKFKGSDGLGASSFTILALGHESVCVPSGYAGVITLTLTDGNKARVKF